MDRQVQTEISRVKGGFLALLFKYCQPIIGISLFNVKHLRSVWEIATVEFALEVMEALLLWSSLSGFH